MLEMFYGIALKSLFGLFLVSLHVPVASYISTGGATSLYLFEIMGGYRVSKSFASTPVESSIKCARVCVREGNCSAASYDMKGKICELHSENLYSDWNGTTSTIVAAQGWELLMTANVSLSNTPGNVTGLYHFSRVMRKPVFEISDQVLHKLSCAATEDG